VVTQIKVVMLIGLINEEILRFFKAHIDMFFSECAVIENYKIDIRKSSFTHCPFQISFTSLAYRAKLNKIKAAVQTSKVGRSFIKN
jgi:hypothetical protein